ncbi:ABC transporter ATP-binding protein [Haloarcula sp. CBA1122]|uniref:ABC transporter ATP-binding protein n=1 Tax=Haloarcula sp. CBA1122 TaxID=2668069 RepID=UPI00352F008C
MAEANEGIQTAVQAGTQGIRDIKLFGLKHEMFSNFKKSADAYVSSSIKIVRNKSIMQNGYELLTALTVFVLIYVVLRFTSLSIAGLGVYLFAMFRLAPRVSNMNTWVYKLEGALPHLVRTQNFIDELHTQREPDTSSEPVPDEVDRVAADGVSFSYGDGETVLRDISFAVENGEFVAFVGPSGAGKSTVVSLLTRLYEPDSGSIIADGTSIDEFDIQEWREHVSAVRQHPYIFNDTLWYNLTVANRKASEEAVKRACEVAQVTEFFDELPDGYETQLGDNGVRLSGGQKQRVALARALLKESDLLLLDEATSDLDTNIESKVHDGIESLEQDRAMIVVAHRLSTVINADRIYAVEDGRIVEQGTHNELLANEDVYAELYSIQA